MTIEGTIESIIYKNDENGYTVARALLTDGNLTTIVGVMPFLGAGEIISADGEYVNHAQHGRQFSVESILREMPDEEDGIYQYLASRTVKNIGPKTARAIVDAFGNDTFRILATEPDELMHIKGITQAKSREMQASFLELNTMRVLIEFLSAFDLPTYFASMLFKIHGGMAIEAMRKNPFLLCEEPFSIDFSKADELAGGFGISADSPLRLQAALLYELSYNLGNGHAFIPREKLVNATAQLCEATEEGLYIQLEDLESSQRVITDKVQSVDACYLANVFRCECFVADDVFRLCSMHLEPPYNLEQLIKKQEQKVDIIYAEQQRKAIALCFEGALSLITGGPGTGKTTALLTIVSLLETCGFKTVLAAPTGRAAKRMSTLTGREAKTLHRLLEAAFDENGFVNFKRNSDNKLDADVIIVDEASMVDLTLAAALLEAMKSHARLILVGDADQLPPVGAGSFFADLLACGCVPSVRLNEIFRQAQGSDIIVNAHKINNGESIALRKNDNDFFFTACRSSDTAISVVISLMADRIPKKFGIEQNDIQVICPSRLMACGTVRMNACLQEALNPESESKGQINFGNVIFRLGDRVMQIRNNYDRLWKKPDGEIGAGVYNGDTGEISILDRAAHVLFVKFDDREAEYSLDDLPELEHAYAVTVHKSQGSEYGAVIIPAFAAPERLLSRNLFYTAVTRAKKLLVIAGREEMIEQMIATTHKNRRYSALKTRIKERFGYGK